MYRAALRSSPSALRAIRPTTLTSGSRRLLSTAPADKKRTWKGTGLRWGLAIAAVYFYNTSPIFADELPQQGVPAPPHFSDSDLPTIDAMIEDKRRQAASAAATPPHPEPTKTAEATEEGTKSVETKAAAATAPEAAPEPGSPEALEQEATQQGAFDPETGEINWDCPCLGGMAHGPCGEEFKAAFSCFVYSKEEPKGMDCIDKFQHMQDCFRKYPEIYGSELADDDDDDEQAPAPAQDGANAPLATAAENQTSTGAAQPPAPQVKAAPKEKQDAAAETARPAEPIPKQAIDATDANNTKGQ
ncbi:Mitochondrial intermembrane space import and assembly protein 40 [Madurella mycetomatis]|uniref:Mitochondrial intermembrane space import and assembly protein 40 n=1 Tax=Madurella mycetomatis TaxID=100816 RepID=A0A175VNZ7_9PEZI|nr:Mitochondrial intermembrane space import and assembly protein 40 [Madurella mycetomatis]